MSYDEFCIAAFDKDVDELRNQNKKKYEDTFERSKCYKGLNL